MYYVAHQQCIETDTQCRIVRASVDIRFTLSCRLIHFNIYGPKYMDLTLWNGIDSENTPKLLHLLCVYYICNSTNTSKANDIEMDCKYTHITANNVNNVTHYRHNINKHMSPQ